MIAFTHPGKVGDLLYCLPAVKKVCEARQTTADFYTSSYCYGIVKRLLERQSYINQVICPPTYIIERMDMGVQPWEMPVDSTQYDEVFQLGFRSIPNKALPAYLAETAGVKWDGKIEYEYDDLPTLKDPYIVIAPRGESSYKRLFIELASKSPVATVVIGSASDYIGVGVNQCGLDLLETLPWIAKSRGFVGLMSSQLVLANGFPIPRISPHDGIHCDMNHVIRSNYNYYPINPSADKVLQILGLK